MIEISSKEKKKKRKTAAIRLWVDFLRNNGSLGEKKRKDGIFKTLKKYNS